VLYNDSESETGWAGPDPDYLENLIGTDFLGSPAFSKFVLDAYGDTMWVDAEPYVTTEQEALRLSWEDFAETVKHRTRFVFALMEEPEDPFTDPGAPVRAGADFLREVGKMVRQFGLVREIGPEEKLYRVRICEPGDCPTSAKEIGAPPPANASQNRMSPAGISMAYCALEPETAVAETLDCDKQGSCEIWTAEFHPRALTIIVDLGLLPEIPSFFDLSHPVEEREKLQFLYEFCADLSRRSSATAGFTSSTSRHRSSPNTCAARFEPRTARRSSGCSLRPPVDPKDETWSCSSTTTSALTLTRRHSPSPPWR
jgi:hypothetical protein